MKLKFVALGAGVLPKAVPPLSIDVRMTENTGVMDVVSGGESFMSSI
jgi:hypothetical protein